MNIPMKKNTLKTPKTKNKGFTLIELMVTVSIAAILLSIAVPSFKTMFKNNRITAGTNEFVAALILARSEALKRNNNVSVCSSSDQQTCSGNADFATGWIVFMDCDQDGTVNPAPNPQCGNAPEQIIKVHEQISKISIKAQDGQNYLNYTFSGRIRPNDNTTLEVTEKDKTDVLKSIVISMTGRVRTE